LDIITFPDFHQPSDPVSLNSLNSLAIGEFFAMNTKPETLYYEYPFVKGTSHHREGIYIPATPPPVPAKTNLDQCLLHLTTKSGNSCRLFPIPSDSLWSPKSDSRQTANVVDNQNLELHPYNSSNADPISHSCHATRRSSHRQVQTGWNHSFVR